MNLIVSKRGKPGTSPGQLKFTGRQKVESTRISSFNYDEHVVDERTHDEISETFKYKNNGRVTWINIDGLHDEAIIAQLGQQYEIHPLVLEDILSPHQRPKVELYDSNIYIVLKMISYNAETRELTSEQVSLVLGKDFVLSFQERPGDVLDPVRLRLRPQSTGPRIRKLGADYLAYAIIDVIIDHYFIALESLDEIMEHLEDDVLDSPTRGLQLELRAIKHNLILVRRATWPVREMLAQLDRSESPLIREQTKPFIRDAYDHSIQVIEIIESLRDLSSGLMDLYMTSISNRMNDIMKVLTIMGSIFIPLTFIAGIYGMNFQHMPELSSQYGYYISLGVMALIAITLLVFFRRKQWI